MATIYTKMNNIEIDLLQNSLIWAGFGQTWLWAVFDKSFFMFWLKMVCRQVKLSFGATYEYRLWSLYYLSLFLVFIKWNQCIWSVLLALDNPIVDYFSLDVEGSELPILKSLDWDNVNISVISGGLHVLYFWTDLSQAEKEIIVC